MSSSVSVFFAFLFYAALAIFIIGLGFKIRQYWLTPAPLKIPTAPTPLTQSGVFMRMFREVVLFESLFKSSKWTWIFGWLFHFGLVLILIRHLRYFIPGDLPLILTLTEPFKYASFMMIFGLAGLLVRRIFVDRVRYISAPSDYLMLLLFIVIVGTGMVMTFTPAHTDVLMVKDFFSGLMIFNWSDLPSEIQLLIHIFLVLVLLMIFPLSKLLHAPGVFFSPTRNQVDDSRKRRHIAPWALAEEKQHAAKLGEILGEDKGEDKGGDK